MAAAVAYNNTLDTTHSFKSTMSDISINSFRSVSPLINKKTILPLKITLEPSKKRFRDEEDMFADIIRIESSTEISDQGITSTKLYL